MIDKLVIVESPAKANTIKKYLGGKSKVVASMGHIRDLPKSKMGINIENDFLIIKHSLCDMGIYDECMKFVTMSEEMDELLVDNEQEKDPQRKDALCVRIDGLEYKILEIKHHIDKIPFKRSYNNFINLD